jgi:hypothetical protein
MTRAVDIEGRGVRVEGRGIGVGSDIPDSGLSHDYNALEEATGTLSTWTDRAGSEDLTAGTAPSVVSDGINGNLSVRFDDTDDVLTASSPSTWAFLHDGSPFSVYLVAEAFGTGVFQSFVLTQSFFAARENTGIGIARDDSTTTDALRVFVSSGSNDVLDVIYSGEFPASSPKIFCVRFDGSDSYRISEGKTAIASPTGTGHSTADPDQSLLVGDDADPLNSDVGRELYYGVEHSDSTRDQVVDALASDFGIAV